MIDVIKYDDEDALPISVIVPLSKKRSKFFYELVFPMLENNMPREIIINDSEGTAPKKRNDGFDKSTQPYIFFCDDDIVLLSTHLQNLYKSLLDNNDCSFAYSGYYGIVMHPQSHPMKGNFKIETKNFNLKTLKNGNYISTMSLIKRDVFPRFDESLKRLQDYDLWLTITSNGQKGVAVHNNEFYAYYLDEGITANTNNEREAIMSIINKHKLGM